MKLTKENLENAEVRTDYIVFDKNKAVSTFFKADRHYILKYLRLQADSIYILFKNCDFFPASDIKMPEEFTNNRKDESYEMTCERNKHFVDLQKAGIEYDLLAKRIDKLEKYLHNNNPSDPKTLTHQLLSIRKDVDDLINDKGWKPKPFTTFADMTGKPERPEKILCAAIEFENNMGKQLIGGATHELIEMSNQAIVYHGLKNKKYGFLTSWQRFVNSKEAYEIHMPKELIQSNYNNHIVGHLNPSDLL